MAGHCSRQRVKYCPSFFGVKSAAWFSAADECRYRELYTILPYVIGRRVATAK